MKLRLLCLFLFALYWSLVYGTEIDGKAYLKKGKAELESRKYEDAILSLSVAEREFPLLGDYALLWLSNAHQETGNYEQSLKTIHILLNRYPDSPLRKKARISEIRELIAIGKILSNSGEVSKIEVSKIFESYVRDYPDDEEMRFMYGQWLKNKGEIQKAKSVFKGLYVGAGAYSGIAYNELDSSDINAGDLLERASNLINARDFKEAESSLRTALAKDDRRLKNEILQKLGLSLFRQKRYKEAAEIYRKVDDKYWMAYSLYRSGEKEAFNAVLNELLKKKDKKAGPLLITVASDKRRDLKTKDAIITYQKVIEQYPSETEDALWGIGWTYFLTGEYRKAIEVFDRLCSTYDSSRYLYWKARSLEALGKDAMPVYRTLMTRNQDFYSVLSYIRTGNTIKRPNFLEDTRTTIKKSDRVEALFDLGMSNEALLELIYISKNISSIDNLIYISSKFKELCEYNHMVTLAVKMPYMERLHQFWYPLAYWDIVEGLSEKYSIDPLLVLSVMREESRFDPEAKSVAGARGLMQIMPQTAYQLDSKLKLGINVTQQIHDVKNNLHLGIYYLSNLINEFGSYPHTLAAYNAGGEIVKKWIQNGRYKSLDEFIEDIPYSETRNYVKSVLTTYFEYKKVSPVETDMIKIPSGKL
ncbi:MAG: transglycosylase SLT domain-containing protein [Nitrospirota bacterium]